MTGRFNKLGG